MSAAQELEIAVTELVLSINQAALSASERGLNILRNTAMEVLSHDGTGRRYGKHVASAPGQPPAPDKGNLRRNWSQRKLAVPNGQGKGLRITLEIKSKMQYYQFLQYGTRKMARRPMKEPIENKARPPIAALFAGI